MCPALGLCVGLLGACSSGANTGPDATRIGSGSGISSPADPPVVPLTWRPCEEAALAEGECATLTVPREYLDTHGPTVDLFVYRLKAAGAKRSLIVNPGGPGASGVDYVDAAHDLFPPGLDVVTFDPRGVGRSAPVACAEPEDFDSLWGGGLQPDEAELAQQLGAARSIAEACSGTELGPHIGTANVARDLDWLRAALGEDQITYLGSSYGTVLGWTYAALFPDRVRAMVLDGPVDPEASAAETAGAQAATLEVVLADFAQWCHSDPAAECPDDPLTAIITILARAEAESIPTLPDHQPLSASYALNAVVTAVYAEERWPDLGRALRSALDGQADMLAGLSFTWQARHGLDELIDIDVQDLIWCADHPERPTAAEVAADAAALDAAAPSLAPWLRPAWSRCEGYPPATDPVPSPEPTVVPVLVVGATGDVSTPYSGAQHLAAALGSHSVLLSREGDGHTSYGFSRCVDAAVERYLRYLKLPEPDTVCTE